MAETNQDLTLHAGNDVTIEFVLLDSTESPVALNLTGARLRWVCAPTVNAAAVITKDSNNGDTEIEFVDAAAGLASVYLLPADTASLRGVYRHELEIIDAAGKVETLVTGIFTVLGTIL